jgi:hypothetical protein
MSRTCWVRTTRIASKQQTAKTGFTARGGATLYQVNGSRINTAAQALAHVHAGASGYAALDLGGGNTETFQGVTPS